MRQSPLLLALFTLACSSGKIEDTSTPQGEEGSSGVGGQDSVTPGGEGSGDGGSGEDSGESSGETGDSAQPEETPCPEGYAGDPCADIDECAEGTDDCVNTDECINEDGGYSCIDLLSEVSQLRMEMACAEVKTSYSCRTDTPELQSTGTLGGSEGQRYSLLIRVRGIIETMTYEGGELEGSWYTGTTPTNTGFNVYTISISSPAQTYVLNNAPEILYYVYAVDYTAEITADAGATITLAADAQDLRLIMNLDESGEPIVIEDVEPYPDVYDGQILQVDVLQFWRI